jgi:hypothetical protein
MREYGFDRIPKSSRSVAIELYENAKAIEAWRATLSDRRRRRLIHPLSNVRAWRQSGASTEAGADQSAPVRDRTPDALKHWRRFRACLDALPPDQALLLWQQVAAEVAAHHIRVYTRARIEDDSYTDL